MKICTKRSKLCDNDDCKICFDKSFTSHEKSKYWSEKNKKKPRQVFKFTNKKYWFNCNKCPHQFEISLDNVARQNSWCSYCCNPPRKMCDNDCKDCFNKSFASHEKSKYWSDKNKKKTREVFKSSSVKYIFNCDKCSHDFDITLNNVKNGYWCKYCSNKKLCNDEECKDCFEKSFASHPKKEFWSEKNKEKPRKIFKGTHVKYWFNCNICFHTFETDLL